MIGAHITSINNTPVCTLREAQRALSCGFINSVNLLQLGLAPHKHGNPLVNEYLLLLQNGGILVAVHYISALKAAEDVITDEQYLILNEYLLHVYY